MQKDECGGGSGVGAMVPSATARSQRDPARKKDEPLDSFSLSLTSAPLYGPRRPSFYCRSSIRVCPYFEFFFSLLVGVLLLSSSLALLPLRAADSSLPRFERRPYATYSEPLRDAVLPNIISIGRTYYPSFFCGKHLSHYIIMGRARKSSNLGADIRGDTSAPAMSTMNEVSPVDAKPPQWDNV